MNKTTAFQQVPEVRSNPVAMVLTTAVLVMFCAAAFGQAGSKESQKFLNYSEDARESLTKVRERIQETLSYYNSLVRGEAKKPQSAYKGLTKSFKKTESSAEKTRERVEKMQAQAEKVFAAWEADLENYSSDSMRQLAAERLAASKKQYGQMIQRMREAGDAYNEFVVSLNDQVMFMGRDLTAEGLARLTDVAAELNNMAEQLDAQIATVLEKEAQDEKAVLNDAE